VRRTAEPQAVHSPARARPAGLAAEVLALQRKAGNRAVGRLLQRKETGMREAAPTSTYVKAAVDFWNDPANDGKSLEDFAGHLIDKVNDTLKPLGVSPVRRAFDPKAKNNGQFDVVTWTVTLNTGLFTSTGATTLVDLDVKEAAELVSSVYHEARHAEQHFRIARMVAGASKLTGADLVKEIKAVTQMPDAEATAASGKPLTSTSGSPQELGEAKDWEAVTSGRHKGYRNILNPWEHEVRDARRIGWDPLRGDRARADMGRFVTHWLGAKRGGLVDAHIKTIGKLKATSVDTVVLANLRAIDKQMGKVEAAWNKLGNDAAKLGPGDLLKRFQAFQKNELLALIDAIHAAYLAVPTEKDAHAAETPIKKQFLGAAKARKPKAPPVGTAGKP
jgi:hypothetical protein